MYSYHFFPLESSDSDEEDSDGAVPDDIERLGANIRQTGQQIRTETKALTEQHFGKEVATPEPQAMEMLLGVSFLTCPLILIPFLL